MPSFGSHFTYRVTEVRLISNILTETYIPFGFRVRNKRRSSRPLSSAHVWLFQPREGVRKSPKGNVYEGNLGYMLVQSD